MHACFSMEATRICHGQMKDSLSIKSGLTAREPYIESWKENYCYWKWRIYLDAYDKEATVCYFDRVAIQVRQVQVQTKERIPFNAFPKVLLRERCKVLLFLLSTQWNEMSVLKGSLEGNQYLLIWKAYLKTLNAGIDLQFRTVVASFQLRWSVAWASLRGTFFHEFVLIGFG